MGISRAIAADRHIVGDVTHLEILDPMLTDAGAVAHFFAELCRSLDAHPKTKLLLDFARVTDIRSPVLAGLVELNAKTVETSGQLKLANLREPVHEAFQLTKLDALFDIYDSLHRAMNDFKKHDPAPRPLSQP